MLFFPLILLLLQILFNIKHLTHNMTTLIADSGSTKTDWALVDDSGQILFTGKTQGINPFHLSDDDIRQILAEELTLPEVPACVFFYGSGVTESMKPRMEHLLLHQFPQAEVHAESDLLGAARALLGRCPGIACILGTGANSCLYDGEHILLNTPPLGYILGDEGSGAVLGKMFLNGIFKGVLPESLKQEYLSWSGLDYPSIINKVYRQPLANRYLASIAPFISMQMKRAEEAAATDNSCQHAEVLSQHTETLRLHSEALHQMVVEAFEQFYQRNITPYLSSSDSSQDSMSLRVAFVGSIAHYFEKPLRQVFEQHHHLTVSQILKAPMKGLVSYHLH